MFLGFNSSGFFFLNIFYGGDLTIFSNFITIVPKYILNNLSFFPYTWNNHLYHILSPKYMYSGFNTPLFWLLSVYIWHLVGHPSPLSFSQKFWQFLCIFSSRWTLESTCQVPLKIPLGFWLEVHWIYRLIWGELTSLHYWVFPSRNMVCLSISSGVLLCSLVKF